MTDHIYHAPLAHIQAELRRAYLLPLVPNEQVSMTQMRLSALFTTKILSECERIGITPYTTTIDDTHHIDIPSLLTEATLELGIHNDPDIDRLKRYAYSVFLRLTSGNIVQ